MQMRARRRGIGIKVPGYKDKEERRGGRVVAARFGYTEWSDTE